MRSIGLLVIPHAMVLLLGSSLDAAPPVPVPPTFAADSLKLLHVRDGFEVELVAAEPLVKDPVAIAWGADGKLWVVEMADYPTGLDGKMKSGGRVRFLESTQNDGHYDKSTLFLDGINFPTGIIPWRKGVIIAAAPEIFYAEDTDGDGKADRHVTLYHGFKEGNTQLRVNGLRWGVDGWLYCANGWSGGVARSEKTGQSVNLSGHDFRIKPDEGLIELQSGQTEFGRDCDDWGDWFGCDNSNPLFHFPFDDRYLRRNPQITPPPGKIQLEVPTNPKLYAASKPQKRYHTFEHADHFTSACSAMVYRDDLLFPRDGTQHAFTCEPVHNLVHHEVLRDAGVTFTARRPPEEKTSEFLASEDQWFRPVMVRTGPDGALWVVDMYRYVIEHPDWLPEVGQKELAKYWRLGEDRGRIYRIYPKGKRPRPIARLNTLSTAQLVNALDSSNGSQRDTAQQQLLWRNDPSAIEPLEQLVKSSPNPLARLHALCTLDLLGSLKPATLELALRDSNPAVRRQALRFAEPRAKEDPKLIEAAAALADDPDAKVRLQLACTLGEWDDPRAGAALGRLAVRDADNEYIAGAVMSSAAKHYGAIASAVTESKSAGPSRLTEDLLAMALAANDRDVMARLLSNIVTIGDSENIDRQMEALARWLDGLAQRGSSLRKLAGNANDALADQLHRAAGMFEVARRIIHDPGRPEAQRIAAADLLGRDAESRSQDLALLAALLTPQTPTELQSAAVRAIGRTGDPSVPSVLIKTWPSDSPEIRQAKIDVLLTREAWSLELLRAIEAGQAASRDLDLPRRHRLLDSRSPRVLELARKVLGQAPDPSRQKVVEAYRSALSLTPDATHGAKVFHDNCATCHRIGNVGNEIGPNLRSVTSWTPEAMLVAILDPNRQVEPRYLSYTATLSDGETLFGVITAESAGSITLKTIDGKERTVLRTGIQSLVCTNRSLMPDGLESALSKQDLADVVHYVQSTAGEP